jgi:hypothetical protein
MTRAVRAGLLGVVAAVLAGCGSAPAPTASDTPGSTRAAALARGGHAEAIRLAASLLTLARLPAGTGPLTGPVPAGLRQPASVPGALQLTDLHRFSTLRQPPGAAEAFMLSHVPAGMRQDGIGAGTGPLQVDFALAALPPGIYAAGLAEALVAGPDGGSLLRIDAQVIWYPPRSAAERLDPGRFTAVTVLQSSSSSPPAGPVTRTITSRGQLARLVSLLNGLPAAPRMSLHCPPETSGLQLRFRPAAPGIPAVVVTAGVCATELVSVGGRSQPALWDPGGRLVHAVRRLLAIR